MSSAAPLATQHLQRSDAQGALLLAAVAWISVDLHRVRLHGFRICGGVVAPPWLLHSALVVSIALVKLYALSRVPLSLAAVVFNATAMTKLAVRSSQERPGDWSWNLASTVLLLCGTVMLAAASTTDQRVTAAMIRDRFSRAAVLQHLLLCSMLMVAIMAWIHETFYAFASGSISWPRQLSRLLFEKLRQHDHPSAIRAYAFAVLSGLAAGCAVLSEKCLAEILRTSDGLVSTPTLSLLGLLATAWLVLALLESYWWHHAVIIDASQRELLLRYYLLVWMTVATVEGVVFFDEIDRRRLVTASLGLLAVYMSSANFELPPPIEPKYDDSDTVDPSPHLLDATESLLEAHEPLASAATSTGAAADLEPPPAYRPPAHFRVV